MEECYGGPEGRGRARISPFFICALLVSGILLIAAVLFANPMMGRARAQAYLTPHGAFSEHTQLCEVCHASHEAPGNRLVKRTLESALCFTCHNGTSSTYNIQAEMNESPAANAMHPISVNLPFNNGTYTFTPRTTVGIAPPGPYDCSQCHNPHGDMGYGKLMRAPYNISEYVLYPSDPDPYLACWNCHSATAIINDATYFPLHNLHVVQQQASCTACHASPHGAVNTALVKFNNRFVGVSTSLGTGPAFVDNGVSHGTCTLTCHGIDHAGFSY